MIDPLDRDELKEAAYWGYDPFDDDLEEDENDGDCDFYEYSDGYPDDEGDEEDYESTSEFSGFWGE